MLGADDGILIKSAKKSLACRLHDQNDWLGKQQTDKFCAFICLHAVLPFIGQFGPSYITASATSENSENLKKMKVTHNSTHNI